MAFSMGGYYAPRAAAFEKRFAAGVAWGAHFDYHANWIQRRKVHRVRRHQGVGAAFSVAMGVGHAGHGQRDEETREYTLAGVAEKIECPFLVTQGELDSLSPLEPVSLLYDTDRLQSEEASRCSRRKRAAPSTARATTASSARITWRTGSRIIFRAPSSSRGGSGWGWVTYQVFRGAVSRRSVGRTNPCY